MLRTLVLAAALGASVSSTAIAVELLPSLTAAVDFVDRTGNLQGVAGFEGVAPQWLASQWGNPESLRPATFKRTASPDGSWAIANRWSRIGYHTKYGNRYNVYEFGSSNLPCRADDPVQGIILDPLEQDLFLGTPEGTPGYKGLTTVPLSSMGHLTFKAHVMFPYAAVSETCPHNFAMLAFGLTLGTLEPPYQTLFLQIPLGGNNRSFADNPSWCPGYDTSDQVIYGSAFCVDVPISAFGGRSIQAGANAATGADLLPLIRNILATGHTKCIPADNGCAAPSETTTLVRDPSKWTVNGVYFGQAGYGGQTTTTLWSDVSLSHSKVGTFCSGGRVIQWICDSSEKAGDGWVDVGGNCAHRDSGQAC